MLSLLVPTRQRPLGIARFMRSAVELADGPLEFVVYIDNDDSSYSHVDWPENTVIVRGDRITLSEMWNRCADKASGDVLGHMGDDIVFRSEHWDTLILEVFDRHDDRIVFVHGRDGIQDQQLGTHGFIHRRWVETVGYFVPPYFSSDYNDTWLTEVADALGRRVYLPEVFTEHMHYSVGKTEIDLNTIERLERHHRDGVAGRYQMLAPERAADVEKLRAVML